MSLTDVEAMIASLPEVTTGSRHGNHTWMVGGKGFAWERSFSKADLKRFGDAPVPDGPILAVREAILDGWLACAPSALAESYLASRRRRPSRS
ncbi:MAG: hypothetical protein QM733_19980 [Ilumatobacteraceae bacterium]